MDPLSKKQIKKIIEEKITKDSIIIKKHKFLKIFSNERFVLSVTYKFKDKLKRIIIKFNNYSKELEKEYYILKFLQKYQDKTSFFKTAKPLFIDEKLKLFAYQRINFTSILNYLYSQKKIYNKIAKKIACGTAFFHQIPLDINKKYKINYQKILLENLNKTEEKTLQKGELSRKNLPKFIKIYKQIKLFLKKHQFLKTSLIHGDFQTRNLLLADKGLWFIDFGRWGVFSPAYDIGTFLLQIDKDFNLFATPKEIQGFKTAFLDNYFANSRLSKKELIKEINVFQAFICLQLIEYTSAGGPIYEIGEIFIKPRSFTIVNLLKKAKSCLENNQIDLLFYKYY